jgi:hypothetical protein
MGRKEKQVQIVIDEHIEELKTLILPQELSLIMSYFAETLKETLKENKP